MCKHILHEGVRSGRFEIPEDMLLEVIGRKPTRGAPKKTAHAKKRQKGEEAWLGRPV